MTYLFNTTDEAEADMEAFLGSYTESVQPLYDYESRASYVAEFEGFRSMFMTMGGALSLIIGLVGVLNFINAVLTGILTRKRELAVLQSVGMTGKQLKAMLVFEGLYYTLLALAASLAATVPAVLLLAAMGRTYKGLLTKKLLGDLLRMLAAALIMGGAVLAVRFGLQGAAGDGLAGRAVLVLAPVCVGVAVYFPLAWLFRVPEMGQVVEMVRRRK